MLFLGLAYGLMVTPAYRLASRIADRVVYGGRASPSEVLSEFSGRLSETYATDDVLPRMAAIVGEATRAKEVRVWLRVSGVYRVAASWPADLPPEDPIVDPGEALPGSPATTIARRCETAASCWARSRRRSTPTIRSTPRGNG